MYVDRADGSARFRRVKVPTSAELRHLAHTMERRTDRFLERQGLLERDTESSYRSGDVVEGGAMAQLLGHSIAYRSAVGPHSGRRVFTCQTLPTSDPEENFTSTVGKVTGFLCMRACRPRPMNEPTWSGSLENTHHNKKVPLFPKA